MLSRCRTIHLGIGGSPYPYVVPLAFGIEVQAGRPVLYFCSAKTGHKLDLLGDSCEVSITADTFFGMQESPKGVGCRFESVMGHGICERVTDLIENMKGLHLLASRYGHPEYVQSLYRRMSYINLYRIRLYGITGRRHLPEMGTSGERRVLLVNDMPGYGKVALSVMLPILSRMGYETFTLPTALVSNTFNYGTVSMMDTTDYLEQALAAWKQLGFSFPAICTGYIASSRQADLLIQYCMEQKSKGAAIFVDPIMADDGALYQGMPQDIVFYMGKLCRMADLLFPNMTEACLLAGIPYQERMGDKTAQQIISRLHAKGASSIIMTSANVEGQKCVIVSDSAAAYRKYPYREIPVKAVGTGDIFTALTVGHYLKTRNLDESVKKAMHTIKMLVLMNQGSQDVFAGIPVEHWLPIIDS